MFALADPVLAITLQDHRRALVGRDLTGVTARMWERATQTRGSTAPQYVEAHAREMLEDAGEEALKLAAQQLVTPVRATDDQLQAPIAPPDWAHAWTAALRALHEMSEGRDPVAVTAALPSSDDASTTTLLTVTRALAQWMAGEWRAAAASLPSSRPSERVAAIVHDLVRAHCDALHTPQRVRANLARVLPSALRVRLWPGPASRLDETPFRG